MEKIKKMNLEGYNGLVHGIIEQACEDYMHYCKQIQNMVADKDKFITKMIKADKKRKVPIFNSKKAIEEEYQSILNMHKYGLIEIEHFFRSDWYKSLTDLYGEYMIMGLKRKAEERYGIDVDCV